MKSPSKSWDIGLHCAMQRHNTVVSCSCFSQCIFRNALTFQPSTILSRKPWRRLGHSHPHFPADPGQSKAAKEQLQIQLKESVYVGIWAKFQDSKIFDDSKFYGFYGAKVRLHMDVQQQWMPVGWDSCGISQCNVYCCCGMPTTPKVTSECTIFSIPSD